MVRKRMPPAGFTIVELLIVIVIIGILAAITIVAYNGITNHAHTATLQSDLGQGFNTLGASNATNGAFPADQASAGLKSSSGSTLTYNGSADGKSYCLQSSGWSQTYFVTENSNVPTQGYCSGTTGVASSSGAPAQYTVTTLAGNGTHGYVDGPGASAEFDFYDNSTMAIDGAGNLYVPDTDQVMVIRKVTPAGVVSTYAGNGTRGYVDGPVASAEFSYPTGATMDSSGNIYVTDSSNDCIRMISAAGIVSTLAGTCVSGGGTRGYADGTGGAAKFGWMNGAVVDPSGNLYVVDSGNACIRKVTPSGVVTSFAGSCGSTGTSDGTGTAAQFNFDGTEGGLAMDGSGNLYVADSWNNCIRKVTPAAVVTTFAGVCSPNSSSGPGATYGDIDGTGSSAQFAVPMGIAVDAAGNVYVADTFGSCIRKITPGGVVTTIAGTCFSYGRADGVGPAAQFYEPVSLTLNKSTNVLYVVDLYYALIRAVQL